MLATIAFGELATSYFLSTLDFVSKRQVFSSEILP